MALLAAEEVVVLEATVVNPEVLLVGVAAVEEREAAELELLPEDEGVVELGLLTLDEDAVFDDAPADVGTTLDEYVLLEEGGAEELAVDEDATVEVESVIVGDVCVVEVVLDDGVAWDALIDEDGVLETALSDPLLELLLDVVSVEEDEDVVSEESVVVSRAEEDETEEATDDDGV